MKGKTMKKFNLHDIAKTYIRSVKWDSWREFYVEINDSLTVFEDGALLVAQNPYGHPMLRTEYHTLGVALVVPRDGEYSFTLPDGAPCPVAWLKQSLLVDLTTNRAVGISYYHYSHNTRTKSGFEALPELRMLRAKAYIPRADSATPIGMPVQLRLPPTHKLVGKAAHFKAWGAELVALCKLMRDSTRHVYRDTKHLIEAKDTDAPAGEYVLKLDAERIAYIAENGIGIKRQVLEVPYLIATKKI
jgi:hypothetical protein